MERGMKIFSRTMTVLALLIMACVHAADNPVANTESAIPKDKEKFHLFLLAGQSNMAGRGVVDKANNAVHPRVWMLNKENQWVPAKDPIHFDKPTAGVGLSLTFAKALADKNPDIHIGLIPCAVGGSAIDEWKPDQPFFKNAMQRSAKAMEVGTLKGILWHQGESNSEKGLSKNYEEKVTKLIGSFRETLKLPDMPFIAGELGRWHDSVEGLKVNADLNALTPKVSHYGCVSSEGLKQKTNDKPHFDSESLREFGRRYAEMYLKVIDPQKK
jgi:hypothetical protein